MTVTSFVYWCGRQYFIFHWVGHLVLTLRCLNYKSSLSYVLNSSSSPKTQFRNHLLYENVFYPCLQASFQNNVLYSVLSEGNLLCLPFHMILESRFIFLIGPNTYSLCVLSTESRKCLVLKKLFWVNEWIHICLFSFYGHTSSLWKFSV